MVPGRLESDARLVGRTLGSSLGRGKPRPYISWRCASSGRARPFVLIQARYDQRTAATDTRQGQSEACAQGLINTLRVPRTSRVPPLPPIFLKVTKPRGPLESTNRCGRLERTNPNSRSSPGGRSGRSAASQKPLHLDRVVRLVMAFGLSRGFRSIYTTRLGFRYPPGSRDPLIAVNGIELR